jgi:HD-GYP domain-containing protein (c-di-GMP phosphodiesterase class II)
MDTLRHVPQSRRLADGARSLGQVGRSEKLINELLDFLALRHPDLVPHVQRSAEIAGAVARRMGLSSPARRRVACVARLHDVGKVALPAKVLEKPGPLNSAEWEAVTRHPAIGAKLLETIKPLAWAAPMVRASHERNDGKGYPDGLSGEQIPLESRIVFVCDAFDAITSERPYQAAVGGAAAMRELERCAGTQFDPVVVAALASVMPLPGPAFEL